jgi:hypothetical protein
MNVIVLLYCLCLIVIIFRWLVLLAEENEAPVENHLPFDVIHILACSILMTFQLRQVWQSYRPAPVEDYIYCYLDRCRIRGRST